MGFKPCGFWGAVSLLKHSEISNLTALQIQTEDLVVSLHLMGKQFSPPGKTVSHIRVGLELIWGAFELAHPVFDGYEKCLVRPTRLEAVQPDLRKSVRICHAVHLQIQPLWINLLEERTWGPEVRTQWNSTVALWQISPYLETCKYRSIFRLSKLW